MTSALPSLGQAALLQAPGTLLVLRGGSEDAQVFIGVADDSSVTAFNGHVDLGTGIATALSQVVAEELDVPLHRVTTVLGHTGRTPNQGATIASETIQVAAVPLRRAAATARHALVARAAGLLDAAPGTLAVADGVVGVPGGNRHLSYGDLVAGQRIRVVLDEAAALKPASEHRIVGQSAPRIDIPAKATGEFAYVHDVRVPGMLHGRVVRPPYAGLDAGPFVGNSLLAVDEASVAGVPGLVAVVVIRDFVGVVAEREEHAIQAARQLEVSWRGGGALPDLERPEQALRAQPSRPRVLLDRGDVESAMAGAATPMPRTYVWPYQMHGSIGPSCAVADYGAAGLAVWSGTQNPHMLRADLARVLDLPEHRIEVIRHEAASCYGRNCADDVSADAALLSRAVGRPVRVQLSREQEHAWEPKGAAQVMDVRGGLDAAGGVAAYDFATRYLSNDAPTFALLLTGVVAPVPQVSEMGDRTAVPPYAYAAMRVTRQDMAPLGAGESASVPSAAAIANAVFDATGVRFRELPLTPERVRAGLGIDAAVPVKRRRWWGALAGALAGAVGMAAVLPWRPAYAPVARPDPAAFSAATIERGRQLAGLGACHTASELAQFGGGRPLDTPFGRVWSTNISPSPEAGIGAWSYPAFERAMREGVSRDGHYLYPAHPYTSFAWATDADLQALYAFLMAQPAVDAAPPETRLAFPFRIPPLMAAWNALFLRRGAWQADPARTAEWNRGAYLVETLGHCSACHSSRNALGAERGGAHLAGGMADEWEAPPLTVASHALVPWTADAFYDYLRTGEAAAHGLAAGPMATVVAGLAALPDADIRVMAAYLASVAGREGAAEDLALAQAAEARSPAMTADSTGARLYAGACAACHAAGPIT